MSTCDTCRMPGRCCSGFMLAGGDFMRGATALEVLAELASISHGLNAEGTPVKNPEEDGSEQRVGLPFLPLWRKDDGAWAFWCPVLTREGRCGDYENRPGLCRAFQPRDDSLCAEYRGVPFEERWTAYEAELAEWKTK